MAVRAKLYIGVRADKVREVADALRARSFKVKVLSGPFDIVAEVSAADYTELMRVVLPGIERLPGVRQVLIASYSRG